MTSEEYQVSIEKLGLAIYFLAIAYLGLAIYASMRFKRVQSFLQKWNSTKIFHTYITGHLWVRTISFGLLSLFSLASIQTWFPLLIILYTLPEFLILSVYVMLFFHWLETFVFAHEQFVVTDKNAFHSKWKKIFAFISIVFYAGLAVLYGLVCARSEEYESRTLKDIERTAGGGNFLLPAIMALLWMYWSFCLLSGFPYISQIAEERVRKVNRIVLLWSITRVIRGVILEASVGNEWEDKLNPNVYSMIIVATLAVCEFLPLFFALDWGTISILLLGDESARLVRPHSISDSEFQITLTEGNGIDMEPYAVDFQDVKLGGEYLSDNGFSFRCLGVYNQRRVMVQGFRCSETAVNFSSDDWGQARLLDELAEDVIRYGALTHPHIVSITGISKDHNVLYVISEHLAGHNLFEILGRSQKAFFPETILGIIQQVSDVLCFVHSKGRDFYHGRLTSKSILLDRSLRVKVAGMGLSRLHGYAEIVLVKRISNAWTPPELFRGKQTGQKADVYAFGVIMWELITRQVPFDGLTVSDIRDKLLDGEGLTVDNPKAYSLSDGYFELMSRCLSPDPVARPSFSEISDAVDHLS